MIKVSMCTNKSYIRTKKDSKWIHVVTATNKQCTDHQQLLQKLFLYAQRHPVDKEGLVHQKDQWIVEINQGAEIQDLGSDAEG